VQSCSLAISFDTEGLKSLELVRDIIQIRIQMYILRSGGAHFAYFELSAGKDQRVISANKICLFYLRNLTQMSSRSFSTLVVLPSVLVGSWNLSSWIVSCQPSLLPRTLFVLLDSSASLLASPPDQSFGDVSTQELAWRLLVMIPTLATS
jgi:hypothetical protein